MKIFITGVTGFIGKSLAAHLQKINIPLRLCYRSSSNLPKNLAGIESFVISEIDKNTEWKKGLEGCDVVIHLAAKVHEMRDSNASPEVLFHQYESINTKATLNLATEAAASGIKRFIFLSSIKVNGESTLPGKPFTSKDLPCPSGPYAISKWNAEQGLKKIAEKTGMELVIIRPTLVYGDGVGANFKKLIKLAGSGIPIPLGAATTNLRSFVFIDNLTDLIEQCVFSQEASNQTFLVSDGEDISTAELLRKIFISLGMKTKLFYFPPIFFKYICLITGREELFGRLFNNLQVDISATEKALGWFPKYSMDAGLLKMRNE